MISSINDMLLTKIDPDHHKFRFDPVLFAPCGSQLSTNFVSLSFYSSRTFSNCVSAPHHPLLSDPCHLLFFFTINFSVGSSLYGPATLIFFSVRTTNRSPRQVLSSLPVTIVFRSHRQVYSPRISSVLIFSGSRHQPSVHVIRSFGSASLTLFDRHYKLFDSRLEDNITIKQQTSLIHAGIATCSY